MAPFPLSLPWTDTAEYFDSYAEAVIAARETLCNERVTTRRDLGLAFWAIAADGHDVGYIAATPRLVAHADLEIYE